MQLVRVARPTAAAPLRRLGSGAPLVEPLWLPLMKMMLLLLD
jgi:hypothetical protein